jgi:arginine-tRNA-protein transferase
MNEANINSQQKLSRLAFYATQPHECSYLEDRNAVTLFVDPEAEKTAADYALLSHYGFRRSGNHIYRPHCNGCHACIAIRVAVDYFRPNRNQRRNLRINSDLRIKPVTAAYQDEHFELYKKYLGARHQHGGMDITSPSQYSDFMFSDWSETRLYEIRLDKQLMAVAVVDEMENALSAVYTFYDPGYQKRSLGRFAVLYEIEESRRLNLPWLYLGYWIKNCRKMVYKEEFQPLEYFSVGKWSSEIPDNT